MLFTLPVGAGSLAAVLRAGWSTCRCRRACVAAVGEHGERVLAEAGSAANEIEAFRKRGVLGGKG